MSKHKILVVDDSALMRKYLKEMLEEAGFEVYTARNGKDALEQIKRIDPDLVTLDINMPEMDGLTCLSHIMTEFPRPVLMVSSLTEKGAAITIEALELGAVDYIAKPGGTVSLNLKDIKDEIVGKVKAILRSTSRQRVRTTSERRTAIKRTRGEIKKKAKPIFTRDLPGLVLIGSSTGGPGNLEEILVALPDDFPFPILVSQHMPSSFTGVFAKRLNGRCALNVKHLDGTHPLQTGIVLIGKGDADVEVQKKLGRAIGASVPMSDKYLWHPAVDRMVESALKVVDPKKTIGVLLTGMGYDGAEQMARLHELGGKTIAESEETAAVFGMPRELIERGGADKVLPCYKIAEQLVKWARIMR
ncbi:MAG: chemotaxis-specific protein-glutamate methyltransferase CheB [Desulfonauticus sp.]|nr:chemotaxis-specific protein-glutamate methyltransferase CheB [Desulfonauticus sp.]